MTPLVAPAPRETEREASPLLHDPVEGIDLDAAREILEHALERHALAAPDRLLQVAVPAPVVEPERLLEVVPACVPSPDASASCDHGVLWDPAEGAMGPRVAGVGAAARLEVEGPDRFAELRRRADALFARLDVVAHPDVPSVPPRVYGGLAFDGARQRARDEARSLDDPWRAFGGGCFTLPRILYLAEDGRAGLVLCVSAAAVADAADRELVIDEHLAVLAALAAPTPVPLAVERPKALSENHGATVEEAPDAAEWIRRVEDIRAAIAAGDVEKIVAARRSVVRLARPASVPEILRRLTTGLVASTRFAFCREDSAFLGATPERLVAKVGRRVETEALAGSIESGAEEHAAELLDSGKDRLEQQLVVDAIVRRLEPLCETLEVADRPSVRELKDVLHLHTPIRGRLAGERHVLDLVATLHPTPAVGGVPTAAAVEWIREREAHARGWYAAPVGWFDAAGDGELMVALRSCVLSGDRAWLWAGAGIVADSDPEAELAETALKEQALLGALEG